MNSKWNILGVMAVALCMLMPLAVAEEGGDKPEEIILGTLNNGKLRMSFTPEKLENLSTISVGEKLVVNITETGGFGIPTLANTVEIGVIYPDGDKKAFRRGDLPLEIDIKEVGDYTVIVAYGGTFSILGLYEKITGNGEYEFVFHVEEPASIPAWQIILAIVCAGVIVFIIIKLTKRYRRVEPIRAPTIR